MSYFDSRSPETPKFSEPSLEGAGNGTDGQVLQEGPPFLPDFLEGYSVLAHLYAHFDESGKYRQHPIISLSGLIDAMDPWRAFAVEWLQLLNEYQLPVLRAVRALRCSEPFGKTGKAATPEERAEHIKRFIQSIVRSLNGLAIAVTVDVRAYEKVKALHQIYGEDPHYFAFFVAISKMLTHFAFPQKLKIGLIFDDEQEKAMRCYQLLKKLKLSYPEVAERITSICFSDDRDSPQVQAADLFAHLSRREAMRIFADMPYPYQSLFNAFGEVLPNGQHLCMEAEFFNEPALMAHLAQRVNTVVFAKRVRLPK